MSVSLQACAVLDDESATDDEVRTHFCAYLEAELQSANDFFESTLRRHFNVAQDALGGLETTQPRMRSRSDAGMAVPETEAVIHDSSKSLFALQQYSFETKKAVSLVGLHALHRWPIGADRQRPRHAPSHRCCEKPLRG